MKLREYIKSLQDLVEEIPESAEYEVFSSSDPEGNYFYKVQQPPGIGMTEEWENYGTDHIYQDADDWDYFLAEELDGDSGDPWVPNVVIVAP